MSLLSETHSESTWYIVVYDKQNKYCNSNNCVMRAHFYGYLLLRISMKDPCHKHIKHQTCLLKVNILCSMSWHKSAMENVISHFYVNQFVILCNFIWECKVLLRSTWMKNPYNYLYIATSHLVLFNWNPGSKIYVLRNWQRNYISIVVELSSFELHWVLWKHNTKVCFKKML